MLLLIIFCLPLKLLIKTELTEKGIIAGIYLFSFRIINAEFNFSDKKIRINNKNLNFSKLKKNISKLRKMKNPRLKLSLNIINDLGLQFFLIPKGNVDADNWAITNAMFKSLPERYKLSLKRAEFPSLSFSIYGFFTIFQIILGLITNTKRR